MRRMYFVLPDEASCRKTVEELEEAGVPESHLHVVASLIRDLGGLPEASIWQRTEILHGIEWGIGLGAAAGLLGCVLAIAFPPAGLKLGWSAVIACTAAGAGLGAMVTALIGSQEHNRKLDRYQRALDEGYLVLMVDVPRRQVQRIRAMVLQRHPEAHMGTVSHGRLNPS